MVIVFGSSMRKFTVHAKRTGYNVSFIRTLTMIEGNITLGRKMAKRLKQNWASLLLSVSNDQSRPIIKCPTKVKNLRVFPLEREFSIGSNRECQRTYNAIKNHTTCEMDYFDHIFCTTSKKKNILIVYLFTIVGYNQLI